jgi:hypothetical protein
MRIRSSQTANLHVIDHAYFITLLAPGQAHALTHKKGPLGLLFDSSERTHPVAAKFEEDEVVPVRGGRTRSSGMPRASVASDRFMSPFAVDGTAACAFAAAAATRAPSIRMRSSSRPGHVVVGVRHDLREDPGSDPLMSRSRIVVARHPQSAIEA